MYELYYDMFNDWAAAKVNLAGSLAKIVSLFRHRARADLNGSSATQFAETAGDVLLPAFSQSARLAVRDAYVAQLQRIVSDGVDARVQPQNQRVSIICHSLGCFHTFETLHAVVRNRNYQLHPTINMTKFRNVILVASPLQLIRTAFGAIDAPGDDLAILDNRLTQPGDPRDYHGSVGNWVSITGDLDPIGGYFLRKRAPWAYMDVEGKTWRGRRPATCTAIVDEQELLGTGEDGAVDTSGMVHRGLQAALSADSRPPSIPLRNPHSWADYVERHVEDIGKWLLT